MGDLGAEIFANGAAHVVNQIHQALLKGREKTHVQLSAAQTADRNQLPFTRRVKNDTKDGTLSKEERSHTHSEP